MSYATKYRLRYVTQKSGRNVRIEIKQKDHSGGLDEVTGGKPPFVLNYNGDSEGKYNPIVASEAKVTIIEELKDQFNEFLDAKDQDYIVERQEQISGTWTSTWQGFVIPQLYQKDYTAFKPYAVLMATDGLVDLKQFDYAESQAEKSEIAIIIECLNKIGLPVNLIRVTLNLYNSGMAESTGSSPLDQAYMNTAQFYDEGKALLNYKEILENILKKYGARIYLRENRWFIEKESDKYYSFAPYVEFSLSGTVVNTDEYTLNEQFVKVKCLSQIELAS